MGGRGANFVSNWKKFNGDKLNGVVTTDGIKLKATIHSVERLIERNVNVEDAINAVQKPLKIGEVEYDSKNRPSKDYIGERVTVYVNPISGNITTMHPTHRNKAQKLKMQKENNK